MKKFTFILSLLLCSVTLSHGQWSYSNLSEPKSHMGAAVLGTKAYFSGGTNGLVDFCRVEIYDAVTGEWDTLCDLSAARPLPSGVACGCKAFFAGGLDMGANTPYSEVDIYDSVTHQWTVEQLSVPRWEIASVSKGDKVLFAGGANWQLMTPYSVVDIYDLQTGTWSTENLSEPRGAMAAAVAGDVALFAGGYDFQDVTRRVDIYHFSTGTWTIDSLSVARAYADAVAIGDKILIAGGMTVTNEPTGVVDIYDVATGAWTTASLSVPRAFSANLCGAAVAGKVYFAGGGILDLNTLGWTEKYNTIDIYDEATDSWSVDHLTHAITQHAVVSAGNKLVVAGGLGPARVFATVEIYTPALGITSHPWEEFSFSVFPNPFRERATFSYSLSENVMVTLTLFNHLGQEVGVWLNERRSKGFHQLQWNTEWLPPGMYYCRLTAGSRVGSGKMVKY